MTETVAVTSLAQAEEGLMEYFKHIRASERGPILMDVIRLRRMERVLKNLREEMIRADMRDGVNDLSIAVNHQISVQEVAALRTTTA